MRTRPRDNPVLQRFRAAVTEIYGDRVERVVLYGSRARGDARDDSDYDVAVFLRDYAPGTTTDLYRLADLGSAISRQDRRVHPRHALPRRLLRGTHTSDARDPCRRYRFVKPETALFLEKSRDLLRRADAMMGAGLNDDAGRTAYLAGLHAAQAFIFESTERVYKRHSGVQREFPRLAKDDPRVDVGLRTFLSRAYQLKPLPII